jgi:hypothetical protein
MTSRRVPTYAALATAAILSLLLASGAAAAPDRTRVGFWAGETIPGTDYASPGTYWKPRNTRVYTPHLWRVLSSEHIPLYFNLRFHRDFGSIPKGKPHRDDALSVIRTANRLGVPVWGWVLIPFSDGYWASEEAAGEEMAALKALYRWTRSSGVWLRGLVIDPEPPLSTPIEAKAAILGGAPTLFPGAINPVRQCRAARIYAGMPAWAEKRGLRMAAAPAPAVLDDVHDGYLALQDAGNFIVPKAPWSELFFQAYRSVFTYYRGHDPGAGIVSSYLHSAQHVFGAAGQISLGSAGRRGYLRFSHLVHDVRLAATLGARDVPIYSLERTLHAYGGPDAVLKLARAARHPFTGRARARATASTPGAEAARESIRSADAAAIGSSASPRAPNVWPGGCAG